MVGQKSGMWSSCGNLGDNRQECGVVVLEFSGVAEALEPGGELPARVTTARSDSNYPQGSPPPSNSARHQRARASVTSQRRSPMRA